MATMGKRKLKKDKRDIEKITSGPDWVLVSDETSIGPIIQTAQIHHVAALNFGLAFVGGPIMREGFVTETGVQLMPKIPGSLRE